MRFKAYLFSHTMPFLLCSALKYGLGINRGNITAMPSGDFLVAHNKKITIQYITEPSNS